MEIKRRKKRKLLTHDQFISALKLELKQTEDEAVSDELLDYLKIAPVFKKNERDSTATKADIEEEIELKKFLARSRVVKKARADAQKSIDHLYENYKREINYSKEKIFPWNWMLKDKKINTVIESRPIIINSLNYVFNFTRRLSKEKRKKMFELTESVIGNKKYKHKGKKGTNLHPYTVFVANDEFYQNAAATLKCSVSRIKTVMGELVNIGAVIKLGTVATDGPGHPPGLYSDGYLSDYGKKPFLKNSPEYREALRSLSQKNLDKSNLGDLIEQVNEAVLLDKPNAKDLINQVKKFSQ